MNAYTRFLTLCVLSASGLLSSCGDDRPDKFIQSAKGYIAKNDNKAAIIQLKTALQKQADSPEARLLLGQALLESGDPVSAEVELRKALALGQADAAVIPMLARALSQTGADQKLIQEFAAAALADSAATADLKTSLAIAYARLGKQKERDAAIDAALAAVPDYTPARRVQARLKAEQRDFDGALQTLDAILAKAPADHEAWQFKGDLLYAVKGDAAAALEAHRKALSIKNDFMPAHSSIVAILLAKNDLPAAKAQIDAVKKLSPNHLQTKYLEAEVAMSGQDYKTARELAQLILKFAPNNLEALLLAGAVENQGGSLLQAENFLTKALQVSDRATTRKMLAQTYLRSGNLTKMLETLAPLLESPDADAEVLSLAAQAHLQTGDVKAAETYFGRAIKRNPADVKDRTAMALIELSKGNTDAGYAQLRDLAATDSGTVADMALISTAFRQTKFDAALKAIDALEKKQPGKPIAADLRGRVQLARKDFAGARQSFEKALAIDPGYFPAASKLAGLDLEEKKPDLARRRFDALLKTDPNNVQALLALAELKGKTGGSKDDVAALLRDAVRLNPTVATPRLLLIDHYLTHKDAKAGLTAAQEAIAARPDSAELVDALGRAQLAAGEFNQAIISFKRLAEMRPKSLQPLLRLADLYGTIKDTDAARQSLKRALLIAPDLMAVQRGLVALEMTAGRPQQALAVAKSVQAMPRREAVGSMFIGDIEAAQEHWSAAAAAYRAGLKKAPNSSDLAIKLNAVLISASQVAEADKFATGWLKEHPRDVAFLQYLGDRAASQLEYAKAESHYLVVIQLQPDNAVVFNNLAWVTARLKKPDALAHAEKANALRPDQPAFMDTMAMILAESNQLGKALDLEKRAVGLQPQHAPFRLNLARLYIQSGDKASAKTELDQLAKLGDKFPGQAEVERLLKTL